jgi:hypothetical protein
MLTDPISLERGVGPDCIEQIVFMIKALAAKGHDHDRIALVVGMPCAFVDAVLNENVRAA